MTLIDLKGRLLARQANIAADHRQKRETVLMIEADLIRARREADQSGGALHAVTQDLADVDAALQASGKPAAAPLSEPGKG